MSESETTIRAYYEAFNAGNMDAFLALLTDDVAHDICQGGRQIGREAFADFMQHMNRSYRERITDLIVMVDRSGTRAAAEFVVHGTYIATDEGVPAGTPAARGQTYKLTAGAFFEIRDSRVARVTNHYNLSDWISQVTKA